MSVRQFCRQQLGDLFGLLLIPLAAALMPTRAGHRLIWRAARWRWLLPDREALAATAVAMAFPQARRFEILQEWRWIFMSEMADTFRLILGQKPRLDVVGQWPGSGVFVAGCMHFGSGMLGLWHLARVGCAIHLVYRPVKGGMLRGRPIARLVYGLRFRLVKRLCPDRLIPTGGAFDAMVKALSTDQGAVMVAIDTPAAREHSNRLLPLGGAMLPVRTGVEAIMSRARRPLVPFVVRIDRGTGRRILEIDPAIEPDGQFEKIGNYVARVLREQPGQFHMWHALPAFLCPGDERAA